MFVDLKSIFLASLMFVELTQKISEWRLVEKKVYAIFEIHKNYDFEKNWLSGMYFTISHLFLVFHKKKYIIVKVYRNISEGILEQRFYYLGPDIPWTFFVRATPRSNLVSAYKRFFNGVYLKRP